MHDKEGTSDTTEVPEARTGIVLGLIAYAMARGISRDHLLSEAGLGMSDLMDPNGRIPELALHLLWKTLADHCPGEAVGLQMAAMASMTDLGVLGHTVRYTDTLRAALQLFARYSMVLAESVQMRIINTHEEVFFRMHHPLDDVCGGHTAETFIALAVLWIHEVFGSTNALLRVEFRHAPHGPVEQYTSFFDVPYRFECPANAMVFHPTQIDQPVLHSDKLMLDSLKNHLELVKTRLLSKAAGDPLRPIRAAITANAERGEYGAEPLAKRLHTGLRTLQRQVREHGTTLADLIEETRQAHARELLQDKRLSVEEISFLLGYSSGRAFRRACLRWTGKTPADLRS